MRLPAAMISVWFATKVYCKNGTFCKWERVSAVQPALRSVEHWVPRKYLCVCKAFLYHDKTAILLDTVTSRKVFKFEGYFRDFFYFFSFQGLTVICVFFFFFFFLSYHELGLLACSNPELIMKVWIFWISGTTPWMGDRPVKVSTYTRGGNVP